MSDQTSDGNGRRKEAYPDDVEDPTFDFPVQPPVRRMDRYAERPPAGVTERRAAPEAVRRAERRLSSARDESVGRSGLPRSREAERERTHEHGPERANEPERRRTHESRHERTRASARKRSQLPAVAVLVVVAALLAILGVAGPFNSADGDTPATPTFSVMSLTPEYVREQKGEVAATVTTSWSKTVTSSDEATAAAASAGSSSPDDAAADDGL